MSNDGSASEAEPDLPAADSRAADGSPVERPDSGGSNDGFVTPTGSGDGEDGATGDRVATTSFAGDTVEQQLDECAELVETISAERDEMRSLAQRIQADFENYKRRVEAQRSEQQDRAAEDLVRSLLEVLDDCDLAASHGADDVAPIATKLLTILERQGLAPVNDVEVLFDPNLHEAVLSEEGDEEDPMVAAIMRTGYLWRQRLLRPAMVKVRS